MTAWDGGTAQHGGAIVACGDPALHAELIELLRDAA
jgi:myo-inositol-1(or 4)-monophosphatase